MPTRTSALLILLLALILGAYYVNDVISSARRIEVRLAGAELRGASLEKATIDFLLNVTNPTGYGYEAELVKYDIYLQDIRIGNGSIEGVKLSPKSSVMEHAITEIRYSELSGALLSALMSGRFEVNVTGYVRVKALIFPVDLRFSEVRSFP
ncbi:MAG: hypothetical protein QXR35_01965 [Candidatus Korarchaeum sp.]